jgi:hypothetical protein
MNSEPPPKPQALSRGTATVDRFLTAAASAKSPALRTTHRLMFGIDATASRQPTWDLACELHDELFQEAARLGNIAIQLCYFRGQNEFVASEWTTTPAQLRERMSNVVCRGGRTQLNRLLKHAAEEASRHPVKALVFIGDCFEEDERQAANAAGQLALRAVPVFLFQEGSDRTAARVFATIAGVTHGAHVAFDANGPDELRRLLGAVARYAVGGRVALEDLARQGGSAQTHALLAQLPPS